MNPYVGPDKQKYSIPISVNPEIFHFELSMLAICSIVDILDILFILVTDFILTFDDDYILVLPIHYD